MSAPEIPADVDRLLRAVLGCARAVRDLLRNPNPFV